jgi:hypothetical protein
MMCTDFSQILRTAKASVDQYRSRGCDSELEPFLLKTLRTREFVLGASHVQTLETVCELAVLYEAQGRHAEAEPLYQRALEGCECLQAPRGGSDAGAPATGPQPCQAGSADAGLPEPRRVMALGGYARSDRKFGVLAAAFLCLATALGACSDAGQSAKSSRSGGQSEATKQRFADDVGICAAKAESPGGTPGAVTKAVLKDDASQDFIDCMVRKGHRLLGRN